MIKNVYFDNIRHCVVFETGRGDGIKEKIFVNGIEYSRQDMDNIVEINKYERNEYRLHFTENLHGKCIVTHYSNYGGIVSVTIDRDKGKYHGNNEDSLLRTIEDDDYLTFSWGLGIDVERDIAIYVGINENGKKIGFGVLVEYGIDTDSKYKYARYAFGGFDVSNITDFYGYQDDKSRGNTDYNFNVKRATWYGVCNDVTQDKIIASHILAAKKGIRGRIARQDDKR